MVLINAASSLLFMSKRIYLDTNVIMDFLLGRDSSAFDLLNKALECKYFIIISDLVLKELKYQNLENESANFIKLLSGVNKIKIFRVSKEDKINAKLLLKQTHYADAVHKILAKRLEVDYLVTKNIKDFVHFKDIDVKKPDEL